MDFVQGTTLAQRKSPKGNYYKDDIEAFAAAIQQLTDIKMPVGTAPGPVGGGRIGHDFFVDCLSALKYRTVRHLEAQSILSAPFWYLALTLPCSGGNQGASTSRE